MTYKQWDIVLVPLPFTDLSSTKKRPALVISPENYNKGHDIVIQFLTSNITATPNPGDYLLTEWKESGLPKASMLRMKFATVQTGIVVKKIAHLSPPDLKALKKELKSFFGL